MAKPLQPGIIYDAGILATVIENLASLNEIVSSLYLAARSGTVPDAEYTKLIYETLRDLSWQFGYEFHGDRPDMGDIERLSL